MNVALTFDDGPSEWTGPILDLLKEHQAKATFFVCGANIPGRIDLIDRIRDEGHEVGNHTTNHPNLRHVDDDTVQAELEETSSMLAAINGQPPNVWRAPYLQPPNHPPAGLHHVGCDVIPGDWSEPDATVIARAVIDNVRDGSVVLLHDGRPPGQPPHADGGSLDTRQQTVDALRLLLPELKSYGYTFTTVSGLGGNDVEGQNGARADASTRGRVTATRRDDPATIGPDSASGQDAGVERTHPAARRADVLPGRLPVRPKHRQRRERPVTKSTGVLLAVPTRGYVWHETAAALAAYSPQYVKEKLSVASVRNRIVREFLNTEAEILLMVDDDVIPPAGFVEKLVDTPYDVVAAPVPIAKVPAHPVFLNVFNVDDEGAFRTIDNPESGHLKVDAVGTGCTLIRRKVLEHPEMVRPFEQQLDKDGVILVGQDLEFCRRVRALGFSIGANFDVVCDHFFPVHANAVAVAYHNAALEETAAAAA